MSEKPTHPSWGIVSLSHRTSNGHTMFLSPVDAHAEVTFTVSRASLNHSEHLGASAWPETQIVEFSMSPVQFAEMITQPNRGQGVACTLGRVNGQRMPDCPRMPDELEDAAARAATRGPAEGVRLLDEVLASLDARIADGKPLGVGALRELRRDLSTARMRSSTDLQYWRKEVTDRAHQLRAKVATELHATADLIVRNMGLSALAEKARAMLPTFEPPAIDVDAAECDRQETAE